MNNLSSHDVIARLGAKTNKHKEPKEWDPKEGFKRDKDQCTCCGSREHKIKNCPLKDDMKKKNSDKAGVRMDLGRQMGRKQRGLNQRIFLTDVKSDLSEKTKAAIEKNPDCKKEFEWVMTIMGTTGNTYHIKFSKDFMCTCPDHESRKQLCKHLFFII